MYSHDGMDKDMFYVCTYMLQKLKIMVLLNGVKADRETTVSKSSYSTLFK